MEALTRRQRAIYDFIVDQVRAWGIPPSLMEIASAFDLRSASGIADHLKAIERKGYIRRRPGISRGIELAEEPAATAPRRSVRVPLVGRVPGRSDPRRGRPKRFLSVDRRMAGAGAFALTVYVDGLERRGILRGDVLIVRRSRKLQQGELVVVRRGDRTLLAEVARGRRLVPVDGEGAPGGEAEALGRVVAVLRSMSERANDGEESR